MAFFEGWSWFKFKNLGLALATNLKFCTSVAKGLKPKVRKRWGPNPTFLEVAGEKLGGQSKESKLNLSVTSLFVQCITLGHLVFDIRTCNLLSNYQRLD